MVASQVTMWFIIVLTGTVLHGAGVTNINTAADAARALQPLVKTFPHAGEIAQGLFALGIVSLGMLAVPVLAGSTSYAMSEARGKKEGLDLKPRDGRYFYGIIAGAMLIGLCLNLIGVNPIHFLVFSAVFNGIAAVPLIWILNRIASDRRVMGAAASGWLSRVILMITFIGMAGLRRSPGPVVAAVEDLVDDVRDERQMMPIARLRRVAIMMAPGNVGRCRTRTPTAKDIIVTALYVIPPGPSVSWSRLWRLGVCRRSRIR